MQKYEEKGFYLQWQFWLTITGILIGVLGGTFTVLWDISSRLTAIEENSSRIEQRMNIGFKHISNKFDRMEERSNLYQARVEKIHRMCCSELQSVNDTH